MVAIVRLHSSFIYLTLFSVFVKFGYGFNPRLLHVSKQQTTWENCSSARARWYGSPNGAGSDGGACGYQNAVELAPFSSLITAAASSLYNSGKACGTCYEVKCEASGACSENPVTVVITDECPGCDSQSILFDLSGTSFGAMARSGEADHLRGVGIEPVEYKRVDCKFPGVPVAFRVDPGSNPYYFATAIEFENGDGLGGVELRQAAASSGAWLPMRQSWGAVWKVDLPSGYPPPFSIRLRAGGNSGKSLVLDKVIPANYSPGQTYRSFVNFSWPT